MSVAPYRIPSAPPSGAAQPAAGKSAAARSIAGRGWPLAGLFFVLYAALSVNQHRRVETTGYDLGIFEQSVRGYAAGEWPVSSLRGLNLLGDHFSPVVALLAPAYRIWPHPETLLLAQALLTAVSIVPVVRLAAHWFGPRASLAAGLGYGLSWGLQRMVAFDFHEVCFAVPVMAFALEAAARQRWRRAATWSLALLLIKEDLSLTIAAMGAYVMWQGRRRLGAGLIGVSVITFVLVVGLIIPHFNPHHRYEYASGLPNWQVLGSGADVKILTLLWLLAPTGFVALRSPLVLLAVPTLAWRFTSATPNHWGTYFHYSAVLMPIVAVALLDGLHRWRPAARTRTAVLTGFLAVGVLHTAVLPLRRVAEPAFWRLPHRAAAAHHLTAMVPDGARVAATNRLAPQLTGRCTVELFAGSTDAPWVVADTARQEWPTSVASIRGAVRTLRAAGYDLITERDGFILLHRSERGTASTPTSGHGP